MCKAGGRWKEIHRSTCKTSTKRLKSQMTCNCLSISCMKRNFKSIKCWIILQKQQRKQEEDSNESKQVIDSSLSVVTLLRRLKIDGDRGDEEASPSPR